MTIVHLEEVKESKLFGTWGVKTFPFPALMLGVPWCHGWKFESIRRAVIRNNLSSASIIAIELSSIKIYLLNKEKQLTNVLRIGKLLIYTLIIHR